MLDRQQQSDNTFRTKDNTVSYTLTAIHIISFHVKESWFALGTFRTLHISLTHTTSQAITLHRRRATCRAIALLTQLESHNKTKTLIAYTIMQSAYYPTKMLQADKYRYVSQGDEITDQASTQQFRLVFLVSSRTR